MSAHIPPDLALVVAALADDDPARSTALEHAARCPDCARLLREGDDMLELIDASAEELTIDPQLKTRILKSVDRAPQERGIRWEHLALLLDAVLSAWLAWFDGHLRTGLYPARGAYCVLWEVLGASLPLIAAAVWVAQQQRRIEPIRLALLATNGAVLGQLWLRHRCPTHDAGLHLFVYHVTGVVVIAALGAITERWSRRGWV